MVSEGLLSFKIEMTREEVTARGGLVVYAEVLRALGIKELTERELPGPGSNRGYGVYRFLEPLLLMVYGGGRHLEDLREIREDTGLRKLVELDKMPDSSTVGDWLVRMGRGAGREGMARVNRQVTRKVMERDGRQEYTLDVDATVIEAAKREAQWSYKGVKGYHPLVGFLAELPLCVAYDFREGNVHPGAQAVSFLESCLAALPPGKGISHLRSDSAFYQAEVIDWCQGHGIRFTITADQDRAVKEAIACLGEEWQRLKDRQGIETDRQVASTIHTMNRGKRAFRLVVQRWRNPQMDLFDRHPWCYQVIATNIEDLGPEEIVWHHNGRAQAENWIKELKLGFGMEQMVSGEFSANAVYFSIGVLAYNTALAVKRLFMPRGWWDKTIATFRWKLINTAGKVVRHGRRLILKLAAPWEKVRLLLEIRRGCLGLAPG